MIQAFYEPDGDLFVPTLLSRGPWSLDSLHGGPPSALMARHLEHLAPDHMDLVRLAVEILRPIPYAPMRVEGRVTRPGKRVTNTAASLFVDDQVFATATAVHIRRHEGLELDLPTLEAPDQPTGPIVDALPLVSDEVIFTQAVEARFPEGHAPGPGPTSAWMRVTVPTVAGTIPSPLEQVVPLADCGNALSWWSHSSETMFPNPDLTVYLHRRPVDGWLLMESTSVWEPIGIGLAQSRLSDRLGLVGHSLQSLYVDHL